MPDTWAEPLTIFPTILHLVHDQNIPAFLKILYLVHDQDFPNLPKILYLVPTYWIPLVSWMVSRRAGAGAAKTGFALKSFGIQGGAWFPNPF